MWERKAGYCENCSHYRPKINNCIDCYVEKLTKRSHEFMINRNEVDSREAIKLASYLQQLGISFHDKKKKYVAQ
jgi:hypothetical protein